MSPLDKAIHDVMTGDPWGIIVLVWTMGAALTKHIHERRQRRRDAETSSAPPPPEWKSILIDTRDALLIIGCLWIVREALKFTGDNQDLGGISMDRMFEYGHLANVVSWLAKCLLRLLP